MLEAWCRVRRGASGPSELRRACMNPAPARGELRVVGPGPEHPEHPECPECPEHPECHAQYDFIFVAIALSILFHRASKTNKAQGSSSLFVPLPYLLNGSLIFVSCDRPTGNWMNKKLVGPGPRSPKSWGAKITAPCATSPAAGARADDRAPAGVHIEDPFSNLPGVWRL